MNLIKAIKAAAAYGASEETGVAILKAASLDLADRWFMVEGVKKAWRRIYVVDCSAPNGFVVEVVDGSLMEAADLITYATMARQYAE